MVLTNMDKIEPVKNKLFLFFFWLITIYSTLNITLTNNYESFFTTGHEIFMGDLFFFIDNPPRNYPPLAQIPYIIANKIISTSDDAITSNLTNLQKINLIRSSYHGIFLGATYILTSLLPLLIIFLASLKGNYLKKSIYAISALVSGVMLFAINRGNIITYALIFLNLFLLTYKSNNKYIRFSSYFFLAIAANLKLYPAIFGILLILRKDWKGCVTSSIMFIFIYIISYIISYQQTGYNIFDLANNISSFIQSGSAYIPTSNDFSTKNFSKLLLYITFGFNTPTTLYTILNYTILASVVLCCMIIVFFSEQEWQKYTSLSLICMFVPQISYIYSGIFILPAILSFISNDNKSKKNIVYAILFCLTIVITDFPGSMFFIPSGFLIKCFAAYSILLIMLIETTANVINLYKFKKIRTLHDAIKIPFKQNE